VTNNELSPDRQDHFIDTFNDFLRSGSCTWSMRPDFYQRLVAANIKSLPALLRWGRERLPAEYKTYSVFCEGNGRDRLQRLWADYMRWREQAGAL
jgi:hypothetical protein